MTRSEGYRPTEAEEAALRRLLDERFMTIPQALALAEECPSRAAYVPAGRAWYIDGPYTHGIDGLACVTDEGPFVNMAGVGPDEEFFGTAAECAEHLWEHGFREVETDVPELAAAWAAWLAEASRLGV